MYLIGSQHSYSVLLKHFDRIREIGVRIGYDTTKNNGRGWCSMQDCGNQEKVSAVSQNQPFRPPAKALDERVSVNPWPK
jgi:hypothetical protein